MAEHRVSVVIPNYNGLVHLRECIDALRDQTFKDFETVIVDNGSTDGSLELLSNEYPEVRVLPQGTNTGFAPACNTGIKESVGELVVLLNNDTRADPRFLEALVDALDTFADASFAASKMVRYDPPNVIDSAGDWFNIRKGAGGNIGEGESGSLYSDRAWILGACAGAAIYRRSMFDDIGLFDEDFYFIFEDVDLSLRAQIAGHKCLYVPEALVFHKRGVSKEMPSSEVRAIALRNRIWVAGKNLPPRTLIELLAWGVKRWVRLLIHVIASRMRGGQAHPSGYFKGYARQIRRALTTVARKRSDVMRKRKVPYSELHLRIKQQRTPVDR